MAEYAAMVIVSSVAVTVYLGGWYAPFVFRLTEAKGYHNVYVIVSLLVFLVKLSAILYFYFWLRWTLPRFRYDQLMDIGWKWLIPSALVNITLSALAIFLIQALDGWHGFSTIQSLANGLDLTASGKALMIVMGLLGLGITGLLLARINWRSRDFNLKSQRRNIKLVNLPQGKPAVPAVAASE
jgi:NADH-quinone oxidoreductase subunit H